jgi:importin subunit alpha-1
MNFVLFVGLDKIEFLQSHENVEIYQKAFEIIERYFGTEDEESAIAPGVDENNEFQFGSADTTNPDFEF